MINLRKLTYLFLTSMLFWPLMSYITYGLLGLKSITVYYTFITIVYGMFFIFHSDRVNEDIKIPKELNFLIFYIIFLLTWSLFNGEFEERKLVAIFLNNQNIAVFFIILIIYNTKFSDHFIKRSIFILKITIALAAIVSVVQVFHPRFLNTWVSWWEAQGRILGGVYTTRRTSIFGYININSTGLSFMPIMAIMVGYMLYFKNRIYIVFLVLGGITAFLSNTRYVMISFIIITLQLLIFSKVSFKGVLKYTIAALVLSLLLHTGFNLLGWDYVEWYQKRIFYEKSIELSARYKAVGQFLEFFPKYFLVGSGKILSEDVIKATRRVGSSHIHVGYLSHLVAYGILGCFCLYSFWFLLVKKLYRTAKETNYWGSFFAFLTFFWAFATFSHSSLFLYGLIFALVFDKYFKDNYSNNR